MTLQDYLKQCSKEERDQLWGGSRTRRAYLYNISKSLQRQKAGLPQESHDRFPSPALAMELERSLAPTSGRIFGVISFMVVSSCPLNGDFAPAPILPGVGGSFYTCPQPELQAPK
jgi:hypothetical protein